MRIDEKIEVAELKTNTNPTERQKSTGNYKKGKIIIKGLQISIENPKGSIRSGVDKDGKEWNIEMPYTYGYFNRTLGKDGDQIDVYLNKEMPESFDVYIVDQVDPYTRAFDEHKILFGFENKTNAKEAYLDCCEDDWKGFGSITKISLKKFKIWLNDDVMNKYPANKLTTRQTMDIKNIDLGDRISLVRLFGEVISEKTLINLQTQAGNEDDFDKLIVEIASPGGSVSEGLEIMMWLDNLSQQGKQIITVVVANAYSIASLIMLSANVKLISKHGKVMVHNPMVPELTYVNANDLEKHVNELRDLESAMYDLYKTFTGLEEKEIKSLMDNETYLSPQEAVDYGFADMVVDIKPKSFEMTTNINKEVNMSKAINSLKKVIAMVNQEEFVNQTYSSNDGAEIEIFQDDAATYKVDDRTSLEEGVITLSDGAKVTIKDFIITDIDRTIAPSEGAAPIEPAVEEVVSEIPVEEVPATTDPAKVIEKTESTITTKEVQNTEIQELISWEISVINDSFELGTVIEYKPLSDGEEPTKVSAGEYKLEDGRKILVDSEGVVQFIKLAEGTPEEVIEAKVEKEVEAKADDKEIEAKADIEAKEDVELKAKISDLENKNIELEAKLGEIENKLSKDAKEVEAKFEASGKFEDMAAEAIDKLASTTTSNFSPNAKAKAEVSKGGSIFQNLKKRRGLN